MMRFINAMLVCLFLISINERSVIANEPDENAGGYPNIMVILADDLGFSDLGCYGGEIQTPVLDTLASNGVRLSSFYNTGRCWPTRASIMTGYYAQQVGRDRLPGMKRGGARNQRPDWAQLLPDLLKQKFGYRAYHSGKWHIDGTPLKGGFDRSYWTPDHGRFFSPKRHLEDDVQLPPIPRGTDYYTTTATADHAIRCLQDHAKTYRDRPFISYVAFIAPHFPLHALPEDIAKYTDVYESGWDVARKNRWKRIQQLGFVDGPLSEVERSIGPPYHFAKAMETLGPHEVNRPIAWNELTPEQQKFQSAKMAIHAAMVHRMDIEIGRIIDELKRMKSLDNTLIMFLSDNGASAEIMVRDDGHDPQAEPGSADTHLCLGPGWSTVSNTPFRRHKTWVHEGGIATPMIMHWPKGLRKVGGFCDEVGHVVDIFPTVLDALGDKAAMRDGRVNQQAPVRPGRSLLSSLQYIESTTKDKEWVYWWLHEGNRALRKGDWKLVSAKNDPWELYDLSVDRNETNNLATAKPEMVDQLSAAWQKYVERFQAQAEIDYPKNSNPQRK